MASKIRARILQQSIACFSEKGYAGTSTKDICKRADVTEGSLFRLFESKEKLFREALDSVIATGVSAEKFDKLLANPDFKKAIRGALWALYSKQTKESLRFLSYAMLENGEHIDEIIKPIAAKRVRSIEKRIRTAIKEGQVRRGIDAEGAAASLYATVGDLRFRAVLVESAKKEQVKRLHQCLELWFRGVLTRS